MTDKKIKFLKIYNFFVKPVISLALPLQCEFCGKELSSGRKVICETCFYNLPLISGKMISILLHEIQKPRFDQLYIRYQFGDILQKLIHYLKYERGLTLARYFAEGLANSVYNSHYDVVTAVPLHPVRLRERGYNQSAEIARHFASITGRDYKDNLIVRKKYTLSQTKLNKQERIQNVSGAFIVTKDLSGKNLLLIDDVITTGSTLNSCASAIRKAGASRVDIAALATPVDLLHY